MADMGRLVRIDCRMLDDSLTGGLRLVGGGLWSQPCDELRAAIEEEIDVAIWRRLDAREARWLSERGHDLLRDRARSFSQWSRELEREGYRKITERTSWRYFNWDRREDRIVGGNVVETPDGVAHMAADSLLNR